MFQTKVVRKTKTHILCSVTLLENCTVYEIMWKNIVERGRQKRIIWRMRIACWITKATQTDRHTHICICHSHCFATTTMFARTRLIVTLFAHCLSCCNRPGVCLLRGTDLFFKYARVIFACKGLISCLTVLVLVVCMAPLLFLMSCGVLRHG